MNSRISESAQRVLVILRLDSKRVFERIKYREQEYLSIFSMKRTRSHFPEIFKNKYETMSVEDLKECTSDVIVGLDQFYNKVDEIRWYLNVTEDMPNRVTDKMRHHIKELESYYQNLDLYINAELGLNPSTSKGFEADSDTVNEPDPFSFSGSAPDNFFDGNEET